LLGGFCVGPGWSEPVSALSEVGELDVVVGFWDAKVGCNVRVTVGERVGELETEDEWFNPDIAGRTTKTPARIITRTTTPIITIF
jgi:ABC-type thiamine transport system substrate-binding protein